MARDPDVRTPHVFLHLVEGSQTEMVNLARDPKVRGELQDLRELVSLTEKSQSHRDLLREPGECSNSEIHVVLFCDRPGVEKNEALSTSWPGPVMVRRGEESTVGEVMQNVYLLLPDSLFFKVLSHRLIHGDDCVRKETAKTFLKS